MSMRRSRIQVKPNIGASKAGARPIKNEDKSNKPASNKLTAKESLKSPEKSIGKSAQKIVNETLSQQQQNDNSGEKRLVLNEEQNQNVRTSKSVHSFPVAIKSPWHHPELDSVSACKTEELTKIKCKTESVKDNSNLNTVSDALVKTVKSPRTNATDGTDSSATPNSIPGGRLRSRFIRKVKPNLSEAGKSRNRKSTSLVEDVPKPAAPVTSNASVHLPVAENKAEESSAQLLSTGSPSMSRVNDVPDVAAEVMVAAEVIVAAEETCPNGEDEVDCVRIPPRNLSPSIADSSISQSTECSDFPSQPEPGQKVVRRRTKVLAPLDKPPDKCKMLMKDLIYWNPVSNPMKVREKKSTSLESEKNAETVSEKSVEKAPPVEPPEPELEEESLPVPQVKIGPDGSIILNEESLVIDRKSDQSELSDIGVLDETDVVSTYASFRTRHLSKNWTDKETERFYYALSVVGTDFSMMSNLFKRRDRYDLKKKFKREEKHNRPMIDKALRERKTFDRSVFENISDEEEDIEVKKRKKREKDVKKEKVKGRGKKKQSNEETQENKKPGRKRKSAKKRKDSQFFCEDTDEEEAEVPTQITSETTLTEAPGEKQRELEEEEEEDMEEDDGKRTLPRIDLGNSSDEDELKVMNSMCQTTRSGRVPKRTALYNVKNENPGKRSRKDKTVTSKDTDPVEDSGTDGGLARLSAVPETCATDGEVARLSTVPETSATDGEVARLSAAPETSATDGGVARLSTAQETSATISTNESMEVHTVQNIPSVGGSQIVLVTQKGPDSSGQGTVIHVYMLSPTSSRTPEWPGRSSPRVNPHVYTASPRPHGSDWHSTNSPRLPSASPRPPVPEWPSGDSPRTPVYSAFSKLPVSIPYSPANGDPVPTSNQSNSADILTSNTVDISNSTNAEELVGSEKIVLEDALSEVIAEETVT